MIAKVRGMTIGGLLALRFEGDRVSFEAELSSEQVVALLDALEEWRCLCKPGLPIMADCPMHDPVVQDTLVPTKAEGSVTWNLKPIRVVKTDGLEALHGACSMEGCTRPAYKFGLCREDYTKAELDDQTKEHDEAKGRHLDP